MIASDKQVVHMYVNVRLPLAGGLIKQTTTAADWSVLYSFFLVCSTRPLLIFFGRPDGKVFLTVVPILPWFLVSILLWMIFTREAGRGCGRLLDPLSDFLRSVAETLDYYPHLFAQNLLLFRAKYCGNFTCHRTEKGQNVNSAQQISR